MPPLNEFPLELGIGAMDQKTRMMGLPDSGKSFKVGQRSELSMGWVDPRVGLGWVGNGSKICVLVGWVESWV